MKRAIEIPDRLFRQAKSHAGAAPTEHGWRTVFGLARPEEVGEIDSFVGEELERIDPDAWR